MEKPNRGRMFILNIKIKIMKELKLLFTEAYKEVKRNPLEALYTLGAFIMMCVTCYLMMIVLWVIGG